MRLSDHTILITGGASGIGLALVERFVRHRNRVIIVGRDEAKLTQAKALYPGIAAYPCDLESKEQTDLLIERLYSDHPELSVVINNAGVQFNYSFAEARAEAGSAETADCADSRIAREIAINLTSPIRLVSGLIPLLARRDEAAIVNVTSGLAIVPKKSAPVYCATKAGLRLFTRSLRYQLEPTNIRVFEIVPPVVDTAMTAGRGRGKILTEQLVDQFWTSYGNNRLEIPVGKVKLLLWINRLFPGLAEKILKNS